jgi:dolichol-phosphate mannosyltransferase
LDTLVLIPTFKEAENLKILIPQIMDISPNLDVLIVDDDSQDGTPILIKKLQLDYGKRIQLLTRKNNPSYADSFLEGIKFAIANGYECVIQMDADGSHPPMGILGLLNASGDLVI